MKSEISWLKAFKLSTPAIVLVFQAGDLCWHRIWATSYSIPVWFFISWVFTPAGIFLGTWAMIYIFRARGSLLARFALGAFNLVGIGLAATAAAWWLAVIFGGGLINPT